MDTAAEQDLLPLEEVADAAVSAYSDDEGDIALFPTVDSLNDRQFLAVMRDDEVMLGEFLEQHISDHKTTVARLVAHPIVRYEFEALNIAPVYHEHFVKMSLALQLFCLRERNFSTFVDRCSPLLVVSPFIHMVNPAMVAVDRTVPSLRMSVLFQTMLRFASDVSANIMDARPMEERFQKQLCDLEVGYNEHCQLLDALRRFMASPQHNFKVEESAKH